MNSQQGQSGLRADTKDVQASSRGGTEVEAGVGRWAGGQTGGRMDEQCSHLPLFVLHMLAREGLVWPAH